MALAVEQHVVRVVREHVESVQVGGLAEAGLGGRLEVLLLKLAADRILMSEYEMNLANL